MNVPADILPRLSRTKPKKPARTTGQPPRHSRTQSQSSVVQWRPCLRSLHCHRSSRPSRGATMAQWGSPDKPRRCRGRNAAHFFPPNKTPFIKGCDRCQKLLLLVCVDDQVSETARVGRRLVGVNRTGSCGWGGRATMRRSSRSYIFKAVRTTCSRAGCDHQGALRNARLRYWVR